MDTNHQQLTAHDLALVEAIATAVAGRRCDLFKIGNSKQEVGVCSGTLRSWADPNKYGKEALPIYHRGGAAFVSHTDFDHFIKTGKRGHHLSKRKNNP